MSHSLSVLALLAVGHAFLCAVGAEPTEPPLATLGQVRALPLSEIARGRPVQIEVVVTYFRPAKDPDLFVHDTTGGIQVRLPKGPRQLTTFAPGQKLRIRGRTKTEWFGYGIRADAIEVMGSMPLPTARPLSGPDLYNTNTDGEFAEISGVVRSASLELTLDPPRLILDLLDGQTHIPIWLLKHEPQDAARLIDSSVRIHGICLHFSNSLRQPVQFRVIVTSMDDISIVQSPLEDPFSAPVSAIEDLLRFSAEGTTPHRLRVRGTVTRYAPGLLFVQNGRTGLRIFSNVRDTVGEGDDVEVLGFPVMHQEHAQLEDSFFRVLRTGQPILPKKISAKQMPGDHDAELIQCVAILRDRFHNEAEETFVLEDKETHTLFHAVLGQGSEAGVLASFVPGTEVSLTGICEALSESHDRTLGLLPGSFRILLRKPQDLVVLRPGPWWTPTRLTAALSSVALALFLALLWAFILRRQVEKRSIELAQQIQVRNQAETEFIAIDKERRRLAGELHDTVEQALTAAGFQLEMIHAKLDNPAEAAPHLALVKTFLDRSREEARRAVWGLRADVLQKGGLIEALKNTAAEASQNSGIPVDTLIHGKERRLSELVENSLLRIAQEGITNALKHAGPTTLTLQLGFEPDHVTFAVIDDGQGFLAESVPGVASGHFGLVGMRERVIRLGGVFKVESQPGVGTRLLLEIPDIPHEQAEFTG